MCCRCLWYKWKVFLGDLMEQQLVCPSKISSDSQHVADEIAWNGLHPRSDDSLHLMGSPCGEWVRRQMPTVS
jgi:hypothetical protein